MTPRDKTAVAQNDKCCYIIGGFGPQEGLIDEEEDLEDDEIKEKAEQQGMSLGWFDEIIKFDFLTEKMECLTWKGFEGAAGKAASNAFYIEDKLFLFGGRNPNGRRYVANK